MVNRFDLHQELLSLGPLLGSGLRVVEEVMLLVAD
jgi:hypothetical protein